MSAARERRPIGVTMGEPAGVGGEIALKAWLRRAELDRAFFLVDDPERLRDLAARASLAVPVRAIPEPEAAAAAFPEALPVLPLDVPVASRPGHLDAANAKAVIGAIDRAVELAREGRSAAVVTNPIHKKCLYDAGFRHPGHTEYLAALAGADATPVMMLACPALRVVPVTVHLSLADAVAALTGDDIVRKARITAAALTRDFGIANPRLAVAGLNPHAGEDGSLGREEIEIIAPAVAALRAEGLAVSGPAPADTLFHPAARAGYDAAICMYHDQALIPIKTIDFDGGVNVTLGLPFIRASPDHGTALDIAGTGTARENSLVAALALAGDMARHRGG